MEAKIHYILIYILLGALIILCAYVCLRVFTLNSAMARTHQDYKLSGNEFDQHMRFALDDDGMTQLIASKVGTILNAPSANYQLSSNTHASRHQLPSTGGEGDAHVRPPPHLVSESNVSKADSEYVFVSPMEGPSRSELRCF